jgi:hypothetical protein
MEKRREIMRRKRVTDEYIAGWFSYRPVSKPARIRSLVLRSKAAFRG